MTSHKIGTLVAIPIKGRKLINRSGGKQSPFVQLKLGEQKKRTRASLIASLEPEWDQEASDFLWHPSSLLRLPCLVRLDVFHSQMDMHVAVYDEGKKNELIGDGVLLLHEVIDKGELDVWFPVKYNGTSAGDIYFELTFYAAAPPPAAGTTPPPAAQAQIHTPIRHTQPGYQGGPGMHPMSHAPSVSGYGSPASAPQFPGGMYQPGFNATPRPPFAPTPTQPFSPAPVQSFSPAPAQPFSPAPVQPFSPPIAPYGGAPAPGQGFNQPIGGGPAPFRPPGASLFPANASPQFGNSTAPGGYPNMPQMPQPFASGPGGNNNYPPNNNMNNNNNNHQPRFLMPQHSSPGGQHMSPAPSFPQGPGGGGPPNSYPNSTPNNNFSNNGPPNSYPNNNNFSNNNNHGNSFNNNNNNNNHANNFNSNNFNNNANNNSNNNNNNNNRNPNNPGAAPVTPLMQYNYSLESFP
ncbi:hypothetical protein BC939DRAFT_508904 [Gamsiella multidivaricata]|uniref:uncharacterized protein n=1 Tax=Gamsiella multidivaricata TaxID=101098 RepID=UPI0022202BDE|nr:uncharacterized protein BC939DRAFT_508904 [Gamsiella multidivaricata]KAG0358108.1 hypothetical protein BGZ54_010581 [Gamsiella multidivaricata]KAI7815821.1 hypothetical protein BC939DRAFT_508904 [Gamsiella multidivaricata]